MKLARIIVTSVLFSSCALAAQTIDETLKGLGDDYKAMAEKLEALEGTSDPQMAFEARFISAWFKLRRENGPSNAKAQQKFKALAASEPSGTWKHTLALAGLVSAHHQAGQESDVVEIGEKLLLSDPNKTLTESFDQIPPSIKKWFFEINPQSRSLPSSYNDAIRVPMALAYLHLGKEAQAYAMYSAIENAELKAQFANPRNELGKLAEKFKQTSLTPQPAPSQNDSPEIVGSPQHKISGDSTPKSSNEALPAAPSTSFSKIASLIGLIGLAFLALLLLRKKPGH